GDVGPIAMALNRDWHRAHRMPPRATREQRIEWHVAHVAACACRPVPDSIKADVEKRRKLRGKK
ncbi:hypothetical protein, partial [uncultured Bradyrhizobium sp.]|uniref:hypothetical protein n=2 Tax=Nitrobacteraceae TaxID=41294 RepID=UPI0026106837